MPAIWSLKCTADLHQDNEVSNGIPEITRNSSGGIPRRYPGPGEDTRRSSEVEVSGTGPPRGTGFFSKLHKVRAISSSGTRFSGVLDRHSEDGDQPPQREGPTTQEGGSEPPTVSTGFCEAVSPSHRSVHIHSPSGTPNPPPLPWSSGLETPDFADRRVRYDPSLVRGSQGRSFLVGRELAQSERPTPGQGAAITSDRVRCLSVGLGSSVQRGDDRWSVDGRGEDSPHQLPGASSCYPRSPGICKEHEGRGHPAPHGQCHSSGICEPQRRDKVPTASGPGLIPVGVVPAATHFSSGNPPSRSGERDSRSPVKDGGGQARLAAESAGIPEDRGPVGTFRSGSLCLKNLSAGGEVLQLEARSHGRSSGCLQPGLHGEQSGDM